MTVVEAKVVEARGAAKAAATAEAREEVVKAEVERAAAAREVVATAEARAAAVRAVGMEEV